MVKQLIILLLTASTVFASAQENILAEVKREPKVKDALWTSSTILKVGVINDGSNRAGYADYICQLVAEGGMAGKGVWVQIVDIVKLSRDGQWVKIGESNCR